MESELVREFTVESGSQCSDTPLPMSKNEVFFITKMILDEVMELMATVYEPLDAKNELHAIIESSKNIPMSKYSEDSNGVVAKISEQADAFIDINYYILNAACKKGINLSLLFKVVHEANMAKKDPETGKFLKRQEDGKIIKPIGWQPPDLESEIKRQIEFKSWNN